MNLFMLTTVLVTFASYLCVVEGQSPCTTPSGGAGKCISICNCTELTIMMNKQGKSQEDIDYLQRSFCGQKNGEPQVCCPEAGQTGSCVTPDFKPGKCVNLNSCEHLANFLKSPISKDKITFVQDSVCKSADPYSVCCSNSNSNEISRGVLPDHASGGCGNQTNSDDRIVGGNETEVSDYPWLVLVEYSKNNKIKHLCGGALISDRYVLTAGHCVVGDVLNVGTPRSVRLGEYDTSNELGQKDCKRCSGGGFDCTTGAISIPIEKIIPHPNYDPYDTKTRRHDIALIRLSKSAPFSDFVYPICLPTSDTTLSPPSNWQLNTAGWGAVNETYYSKVKMHVKLPFVSYSECQPEYEVKERKAELWQGQMCAGGVEGEDSCKGDSGGPLMWEKKDNFFEIVGVVSFGPRKCGLENVPGVYTKVYAYDSWIRQNVRP